MKKKSILVMVLAALMLFAFTACEQKMPSYKQIEYVTLAQDHSFIEGQQLSGDAFTVTVYYLDGTHQEFEGEGRVSFTGATDNKAADKVKANVTFASDYSDEINVKVVKPSAFTATVSAADVTREYELVAGTTDKYAPKTATVSLTLTGLTLTGADNASWVMTTDEVTANASKIDVPSDITLTSAEQENVGAVTKEVKLAFADNEAITYTTSVSVNVKASTTDPNDPSYVAPTTIKAIEVKDVTRLGVIWADVEQDDLLPTNEGKTPAMYDTSDVETGVTVSSHVEVLKTPAFTIVGLASDMTGKAPLVLSTEDSGSVKATISVSSDATLKKEATTGDQVTDIIPAGKDEKNKPLTATYTFIPENEAGVPNYADRISITLNVTVDDVLAAAQSDFKLYYNGTKADDAWTAKDIDVKTVTGTYTVKAGEFKGELKTVGGQSVPVTGNRIWGNSQVAYTKDELTDLVGTGFDVYVEVIYDGEYGEFADSVTAHVGVVNSGN